MADLHAIREQLREVRSRPVQTESSSGISGTAFWVIAIGAALVGFGIVLITPRIYSVQRTAALPTFQETRDRIEIETKSEAPAVAVQVPSAPVAPAQYIGKSADEMGKIADDVCFRRAQDVQPHWSKTPRLSTKEPSAFSSPDGMKHFDALMQCLTTEAPARYCSARQRTMIVAEIGAYFRGALQVDPAVLTGIEGLIRAGYLSQADRGSFATLASKPIRDRLANIVAYVSPCPKPPWWQSMWK